MRYWKTKPTLDVIGLGRNIDVRCDQDWKWIHFGDYGFSATDSDLDDVEEISEELALDFISDLVIDELFERLDFTFGIKAGEALWHKLAIRLRLEADNFIQEKQWG